MLVKIKSPIIKIILIISYLSFFFSIIVTSKPQTKAIMIKTNPIAQGIHSGNQTQNQEIFQVLVTLRIRKTNQVINPNVAPLIEIALLLLLLFILFLLIPHNDKNGTDNEQGNTNSCANSIITNNGQNH